MKTNWKKQVNEILSRKHVVPDGWETREQVAEALECSPDRVHQLLKPGLDDGVFERAEFSVWNNARRMTERVTCYRQVDKAQKAQKPAVGISFEDKIKEAIMRFPSHTNHQIAKNYRGVTAAMVAAIREGME